ncbi:3-hydroxyacyl-ACP dehydratase FabZ family protein [Candidatus Laterigemmans baculatus]|uniref:3-hydroxyacyl-ACP dehydratase FabZ family protein n=1 Tax=Candidatus Laterigemmans baculatus TaxID=2770505 RepID=UPI0013DD7972|nr:3-hydroxyacyl-ACP dehydratase FabZ family protein [Candidatus Laterigemmans baculatus]
MRWFWIDRFETFHSGSEATAVKNVALDEEALDRYCPGYPYLPSTLIIEGLAQLGGILVSEHLDFRKRVVLAKVAKAEFYLPATPGDQLRYHARLETVQEDGAMVSCTSHLSEGPLSGGRPQADVQLMFAFLDDERFGEHTLFPPDELQTMLQLMNFFEVAVDASGQPLPVTVER